MHLGCCGCGIAFATANGNKTAGLYINIIKKCTCTHMHMHTHIANRILMELRVLTVWKLNTQVHLLGSNHAFVVQIARLGGLRA